MVRMDTSRGISLMEIVVSLIIVALTLVGLANLFVATKRHLLHANTRMTGAELGKVFLDPLANDVRQDQWGINCLSGYSAACPGMTVFKNMNYTPVYQFSNVTGTALRRVTLTVGWNESAWR